MFRQFILPCTLPFAFVGLVGLAVCLAVKLPIYLIALPLVAVYLAWGSAVARQNREASIAAKENTRLLRRDYPHLLREARDIWPWKSSARVTIYISVCVVVPAAILAILATNG